MVPAQQRLDAVHAAVGRVDLGLVVQREAVPVDEGGAQFLDEAGVVVAIHLERRVVDRDLAGRRLGVRDRRLGASEQLLRMVTVVGVERDRDAGIDLHGDRVQLERLAHGFQQATRLGACGDEVGSFAQQDREVVVAHASQQIFPTHAVGEPVRDPAQQLVAEVAADRIADLVELAEVQQQQRPAWRRPDRGRPAGSTQGSSVRAVASDRRLGSSVSSSVMACRWLSASMLTSRKVTANRAATATRVNAASVDASPERWPRTATPSAAAVHGTGTT